MPSRVQVDRHVVVFDANFRRREGERRFCGAIKDNYGPAKLLEASDRAWLGKAAAAARARDVALAVPGRCEGGGRLCVAVRAGV